MEITLFKWWVFQPKKQTKCHGCHGLAAQVVDKAPRRTLLVRPEVRACDQLIARGAPGEALVRHDGCLTPGEARKKSVSLENDQLWQPYSIYQP